MVMWRRFSILSNYKIRIVIIFTALIVWFHAVTEKQYEHVFQAKVVPVNVPEDYVVLNNHTEKVGVQLRGTGKALLRVLINTKIEINVDLGSSKKYHQNVKLNLENLVFPTSNINIVPIKFVDKDTLNFKVEPILAKEVTVNPQIIIQTAPGYTIVDGIQVHPGNVLIVGPVSIIHKTDFISTSASKIENVTSDVSRKIKLINPHPRDMSMNIQLIEYYADIQQLGEKSFLDISIRILNAPIGVNASVLPSTLSLKIKGGVEVIDTIDRNDILAYVDYGLYKQSGELLLAPFIKLPRDLIYFDVFPDKFELKFD